MRVGSDELRQHVDAILAAAGDPSGGLPDEVFRLVSRIMPLVNVDLLIRDDRGRTLLTWRDDEWFGAGWHVPGGIIRYKETLAERIHACARTELGADVVFEATPLAILESIGPQRQRGHHLSLLYRCRLSDAPDPAREARGAAPPRAGQWRWHERRPADMLAVQRKYEPFLT